jgi:hypothetical protein
MYPNISWKIPLKFQSSKALQNPQLVFTEKTHKKAVQKWSGKAGYFHEIK